MRIVCPSCDAKLKVPDELLKKSNGKIKCPSCGAQLNIAAKKPPTPAKPPISEDSFASAFDDAAENESDLFGDSVPSSETDSGGESSQNNSFDDTGDLFGSPEDLDDSSGVAADLTPTMELDPSGERKTTFAQNNTTQQRKPAKEKSASIGASESNPGANTSAGKDEPQGTPIGKKKLKLKKLSAADLEEKTKEKESQFSQGLDLDDPLFQPGIDAKKSSEYFGQYAPSSSVKDPNRASAVRRTISFAVLMVLILSGGLYVSMNLEFFLKIDYAELKDKILFEVGLKEGAPAKTVIKVNARVQQEYLKENLKGQSLYVVEGMVHNVSTVPVHFVEVQVVLFDEAGEELTSTTVYAGNKLNSVQIRTLSLDKIVELHGRDYGANLSNYNIKPQARIPFQAVFSPVPEGISQSSAEGKPTNGKGQKR
jgi:predicted Zn finger-like uncharacterized protein